MPTLILGLGKIVNKNWLWIAPLLMLSLPASADWTYVDGGEGYERYLDLEGVISLRSRTEYDCMTHMYRITHLSGHTLHMTQGQVVFSESVDGDWEPVSPGTLGETSMQMVCEVGARQED